MKIISVETTVVQLPLPKPVGTAIHSINSTGLVLTEVRTDDDLVGQSHIFTLNGDRIRAFDTTIRGLSHLVVGREPFDTARIWDDIWREINPTGHKGVTVSALSALDVACWDIAAKSVGLPLHKMFGACRDEADVYASSGLWLSMTLDELVTEAQTFVDQGFRAMKVRIGSADPIDDVKRVAAIRDVVGTNIALLVDANQGFDAKTAIRRGRMLEEFDLAWFEEPTPTHDMIGHARVRGALDVPIATGETEYTKFGMADIINSGAADVLMPDLQRIGGYSEFIKAAALAEANNLPVSSHFFTEASLCLAGAISNFTYVEHIDWFAPLFNEQVKLVEGKIQIPARPGLGFTFDPAAVDHHRSRD